MPPCFPNADIPNDGWINWKIPSYTTHRLASRKSFSNLSHLFIVKFCVEVFNATLQPFRKLSRAIIITNGTSSFCHHISHIFSNSAKPEMFRTNAIPNVAMMANAQLAIPRIIIGNLSVVKYPRKSVSKNHSLAYLQSSVATFFEEATSPYPAISNLRSMLWNWAVLVYAFPKGSNPFCRNIDFTGDGINTAVRSGHNVIRFMIESSKDRLAPTSGLYVSKIT